MMTGAATTLVKVVALLPLAYSFNIIPAGQWSEPVTSVIINAFETAGSRFSVTKK
jgi:hypothetical protein